MRLVTCVLLSLASMAAIAQKVILIPLDSRPAAGQFPQLIGRMANVNVVLPPIEYLGRYTTPGKPELILDWLERQDVSNVTAVIVNTDMIAYGGLINSRLPDTTEEIAMTRLNRLAEIRKRYAGKQFYAFSAVMRLYPTATRGAATWRLQLGKLAESKDRYRRTNSKTALNQVASYQKKIPPIEVTRYELARSRNHSIQRVLVQMAAQNVFDYLILGQDDAQPYGPHISETIKLRSIVEGVGIGGKVYFCEGVDQLANVLLSRALLRQNKWVPRVRIVYSDDAARKRIANYESKNIELSLRDQLFASGARPWISGDYDYTLWLNAPDPRPGEFQKFTEELIAEVEQGFPSGVADINLGKSGTADPRLFTDLWQNDRMIRLLSYAGWNTAGNTMGTSIPAANVYLLARRKGTDPLKRELAQREFVLHRFVNDFAYHKYTRPEAYKLIDSFKHGSREETFGEEFAVVNSFVRKEMEKHLQKFFADQFMGKKFFAGSQQFEFTGLNSVKIALPWPRAYEVRLEFRMVVSAVTD